MKRYWIKLGLCLVLAAAVTFLFACAPMTIETTVTGTTAKSTIIETTEPPLTVIETVQPLVISDTEGILLTYMGSPAPIIAFNREREELLAYCFESGSSHIPYVLSKGIPTDGTEHTVYIPDFELTATVLFDMQRGVWRIFMSPAGSDSSGETEWAIYTDRASITDWSGDLRRETAPGVQPRYYSVESGVFYLFSEGSLTIAADMNGDGETEMLYVFSENEGKGKTMDCTVRISGEEVFRIEEVLRFSGAYITDVYAGDMYKEIVLEYEDKSGKPVSEIVRYDGSSVRTKVLIGSIDCSGNGSVYLRGDSTGAPDGGTVIYEVDGRFIFKEV